MTPATLWWRAALVSLGRAAATGGQMLAAIALVRLLAPAAWSQLALLLSVYLAGLAFGHLGLPAAAVFFVGRAGEAVRAAVVRRIGRLLWAASALTAGVALGARVFVSGDPVVAAGLPWVALALLLELPTLGLPAALVAVDRPGVAAALEGGFALLQVLVIVGSAALGAEPRGICVALAGYALVRTLVVASLTRLTFAAGATGAAASGAAPGARALLAFAAPLALSLGVNALGKTLDKWIVFAIAPAAFGSYAVAATEVPLLPVVTYALGAVLAARLVRAFAAGRTREVLALWLAQTSRLTLVVVPASVGLMVCAGPLLEIAFTLAHRRASPAFQLFAGVTALRVAEYGLVLRAGGDTRSLWWSSLVLLAGNAVLVPPLTFALGATGAALGLLLANLVAWLYVLRRIAHLLGVALHAAFPWRLYAVTLGLSLVLGLGVDAAVRLGVGALPAPLELIVRAGGFVMAYVGAAWAFGLAGQLPPLPREAVDAPGADARVQSICTASSESRGAERT